MSGQTDNPERKDTTSPPNESTSLVVRWLWLACSVLLFIAGVELLQAAAHRLEPFLHAHLSDFVDGRASAVGASWLGAYVTLSGSVIAAIALALFDSATLDGSQLLMMIYGSRFGGAGMILLVGLLDVIKDDSIELKRGSTVGLLTFMLTLGIGVPALALGIAYAGLDISTLAVTSPDVLSSTPRAGGGVVKSALDAVISAVTPGVAFLMGAGVLLGGLKLLHHTLREFDIEQLTRRAKTIFRNRWTSFGLGFGLTMVATSVAVSVGAIVPLYNRGVLDRDKLIPYIMGANIGTFGDTILIAWLMERPEGFGLSLLVVATMLAVTLLVLLAYTPFRDVLDVLESLMLRSRRRVVVTMGVFAAIPVALLLTAFV